MKKKKKKKLSVHSEQLHSVQSTAVNPARAQIRLLVDASPLCRPRTRLVSGLILCTALTCILAYGDSREALQKADELIRAGRLDDAERQARLALADPVYAPVAYSVLGAVRLEQRRYDDSIRFLKRALELEPKLMGARLTLRKHSTCSEGRMSRRRRTRRFCVWIHRT